MYTLVEGRLRHAIFVNHGVINPLILVIEDDAPVYTTLKTHDYRYLTAKNGGEAIRMASSHNPNALILDLGLPDMYGIDVIRQVRL